MSRLEKKKCLCHHLDYRVSFQWARVSEITTTWIRMAGKTFEKWNCIRFWPGP